jgi:hypothetical protein
MGELERLLKPAPRLRIEGGLDSSEVSQVLALEMSSLVQKDDLRSEIRDAVGRSPAYTVDFARDPGALHRSLKQSTASGWYLGTYRLLAYRQARTTGPLAGVFSICTVQAGARAWHNPCRSPAITSTAGPGLHVVGAAAPDRTDRDAESPALTPAGDAPVRCEVSGAAQRLWVLRAAMKAVWPTTSSAAGAC